MPSPLVSVHLLVRRSAAIIGQGIPAFPTRCGKLLPASHTLHVVGGLGFPLKPSEDNEGPPTAQRGGARQGGGKGKGKGNVAEKGGRGEDGKGEGREGT